MPDVNDVTPKRLSFEEHYQFIEQLVRKGGPDVEDYPAFEEWLELIVEAVESGELTLDRIHELKSAFGESFTLDTVQGFQLAKPHGYAGDFEIIDKIYQQQETDNPHLRNWDKYFHTQKPAKAVINRKAYFIELLRQLDAADWSVPTLNVLNVASGPGRDLYEFFSRYPNSRIHVDCVENDPDAIVYASHLCRDFSERITLHRANALRFSTAQKFQLVWSAGLFDYFNDRIFKSLLKRLYKMVASGGEVVIGNFSEKNPSKGYMEILGEWVLQHRSSDHLITLAEECEIDRALIRVDKEPEGVNLFLHIKKP